MKLALSAVLLYGEFAPGVSWVPARNPNSGGGNIHNGGVSYVPPELESADRAPQSITSERGTIGFIRNNFETLANEISTLPNAADTSVANVNSSFPTSSTGTGDGDGGMSSYMQAISRSSSSNIAATDEDNNNNPRSSTVADTTTGSGTQQISESMGYHVEFMKSQLEEHSKALTDSRKDVEKWKGLHGEAQSQIDFLERSKASLEKLLDESRNGNSESTRRLEKGEADLETFYRQNLGNDAQMALEEQRVQAEKMKEEFEHQLDNARRQVNSMRVEYDTLMSRLEDSQSRIQASESIKASVESRNMDLEQGLSKAHESIRALQSELESVRSRTEQMKSHKDSLFEQSHRSLRAVQEENASLVRKIEEIMAAGGNESSQQATMYKQDVEMWKQRYSETEAKVQKLESSKVHLEGLLKEANVRNKLSVSDNDSIIKQLQKEVEDLEKSIADEQDSFAEQRRRIEEETQQLKRQLEASEAQVLALQAEKSALSRELEEMQANRGNVYQEMKSAELRIEDLESRLKSAAGKEKLMSDEQMQYQLRIRELESLLATTEERGKEWQQELVKSRDETSRLENTVEGLKANVDSVAKELNTSKRFGQAMKSENDAAQNELQNIQTSNDDLKRLLDEAQAQTSKAKANSARYRAELKTLQNELQATRSQLSDRPRSTMSGKWGIGATEIHSSSNLALANEARPLAFNPASVQLFWERNKEFVVKLVLPGTNGNQQQQLVRRIKLPRLMDQQGKLSYGQLVLFTSEFVSSSRVHEKYVDEDDVSVTGLLTLHYHDSENDTIAITCSEELLDAVEQFSHQQALRLVVGDGMTSPQDSASVPQSTNHNDNNNSYHAPRQNSNHATSSSPSDPVATMRPFIHGRHSCDSCGMMPIVGPRYHATNRNNLDVCQNCLLNFQGQNISFEMAQDDLDVAQQDSYHDYRQKQAEQAASAASGTATQGQPNVPPPHNQPPPQMQNTNNRPSNATSKRYGVPCDQIDGQRLL